MIVVTISTKAALLKGPHAIDLVDRDLACGDDDVIVRNHIVGICGSDKSFYRGILPPDTSESRHPPRFPFPLGHESGGIVVEVGRKVCDFAVGDRVMSFGWNNNFAEYFKARVADLQPAPEGLDMDLVSLGEPISCAMFSGLHSGVQLGDTVVVMGGGFAGQIIAQCAKRKGAATVVVVDVCDGKLETARQLGADMIVNSKISDPVDVVMSLTNGTGADVVVEAAGSEQSVNQCSAMIRHNGKFVWYSWITEPVRLNISRWHDDGIEFINTCLVHHTAEERRAWTPWALRPVVSGLIDIRPLITHRFQLDDIKEAFDVADKDDTAIKVVLEVK